MKLQGPLISPPGQVFRGIIDVYNTARGLIARRMPDYTPRAPTPAQYACRDIYTRCKQSLSYIRQYQPQQNAYLPQTTAPKKTWYDTTLSLLLRFGFNLYERGWLGLGGTGLCGWPYVVTPYWADTTVWFFDASQRHPLGPSIPKDWYCSVWRGTSPPTTIPFEILGDYCPAGKRMRPKFTAGPCNPPEGGSWVGNRWQQATNTITFDPPLRDGETLAWAFVGYVGMERDLAPVPPIWRATWPLS